MDKCFRATRPFLFLNRFFPVKNVKNTLGALQEAPFVNKKKIVINSFPWGIKINKILPPAPYFLVTLDDNLLIKLTGPYKNNTPMLSHLYFIKWQLIRSMPHTVHVLYKKNVTFYWLKLDH
jgi:hypothetical protein